MVWLSNFLGQPSQLYSAIPTQYYKLNAMLLNTAKRILDIIIRDFLLFPLYFVKVLIVRNRDVTLIEGISKIDIPFFK